MVSTDSGDSRRGPTTTVADQKAADGHNFVERYEHMELGYGEDSHDPARKAAQHGQGELPGVHEHVS